MGLLKIQEVELVKADCSLLRRDVALCIQKLSKITAVESGVCKVPNHHLVSPKFLNQVNRQKRL